MASIVDLSDFEITAGIASAAVAIVAVWLGFRYQLKALDRERKRQAFLRAVGQVSQMIMIADAYARYLSLYRESPETSAGATAGPDRFRYTSFSRTDPEFTRRWWSLLAPRLFGGTSAAHHPMRGLVPPEQEEEASLWFENVVAFYTRYNTLVLELASSTAELDALGAPPELGRELAAIHHDLDVGMLALLRDEHPPAFDRASYAARLDATIASARGSLGFSTSARPRSSAAPSPPRA